MLTSLFGELAPLRTDRSRADRAFAATAILDSVAAEVAASGRLVDHHTRDLVVTGSPARAIRDHGAALRAGADEDASMITLLDPAGMWSAAVIKALSDAGGRPIERLHLREHATLRTLATIERTTLVRRHEDTLRIAHVDVRDGERDSAEIPYALMERSQLAVVVIGPLQPHAIDALLAMLLHASMRPDWHCPHLLFLLPPGAAWIANKIGTIGWPARLHVHVLSESLNGASAVWNAMLGVWNRVRAQTGWETEAAAPQPLVRVSRAAIDPHRALQSLTRARSLAGLIGCAVVDANVGLVLARERPADDAPQLDLDLAASAAAQALRSHRQSGVGLFGAEPLDEIITTAGSRQQVIRCVATSPELFVFALLDRSRANLALARLALLEAAHELA